MPVDMVCTSMTIPTPHLTLDGWLDGPIEIIPAVDVLGTSAVRLHQGDYDAVVADAGDPIALAAAWANAGASRVHLVDLDGARSGRVRPEIVAAVATAIGGVKLQASGGIRSLADAASLLEAGAANHQGLPPALDWPAPKSAEAQLPLPQLPHLVMQATRPNVL